MVLENASRAMVGGWYCDKKSKETGEPMISFDYMKGIEKYNKVDCKVMWELINYLRKIIHKYKRDV